MSAGYRAAGVTLLGRALRRAVAVLLRDRASGEALMKPTPAMTASSSGDGALIGAPLKPRLRNSRNQPRVASRHDPSGALGPPPTACGRPSRGHCQWPGQAGSTAVAGKSRRERLQCGDHARPVLAAAHNPGFVF